MASKKDFSTVTASVIDNSLAAEPMAQEEQKKPRKQYTQEQQDKFAAQGNTAGRKNCKMKRINMAFPTAEYEYIKTMSRVRGTSITDFVNTLIKKNMEENAEIYAQAIKFKNSI